MFSGKYSEKRVKVTVDNYTLFLPLSAIREILLYAGNNKVESFYVDTKENCILINLDKIPINEIWGIRAYVNGWRFKNDVWVYKDVKLKHMIFTAYETFNDEEYYDTGIKGREVVDVGGGIGDTAVYFAKMGASKVITIEPLPILIEEIKTNLKLNNVEDKVVVLNAALASSKGKIKVPTNYNIYYSFAYKANDSGEIEVDKITLTDVLKIVNDPYLLKMDCEGCEYDIIMNDYENLNRFEKIIFEFHYPKKINEVLDKLGNDFMCEVKKGKVTYLIRCSKKT
ncbi:FkbM family methyltransferase [Acidianus manzaensis]|uniref:FkbM family methyltransferase n=1 Tax=Acidianus manzaensis TaxID=282676 RepID=A0A1W6K0V3_9CREN|nr:FkbM family methyltransferase [Acidianus manzaensis]ARM76125.1 FkbM family methyltransferase [Acidianus manzaensis]